MISLQPIAGSDSTVEVVSLTLQRICEDFKAEELSVMWNCLYKETEESIVNKKSAHLSRLLTVLTSAVRAEKGLKVYGKLLSNPIFRLAFLLLFSSFLLVRMKTYICMTVLPI